MRRKKAPFVAGLALAAVVGTAVLACSSEGPLPPMIGDCTPTGDAGCSVPGQAGGSGGPPDGGTSGIDGSTDAGAGCGATIVATQNTTCAACIEASCCQANQSCSEQSDCSNLVTCTLQCTSSDQSCISICFNTASTGQTAYNDLSACLSTNCPGCPPLPAQGVADF